MTDPVKALREELHSIHLKADADAGFVEGCESCKAIVYDIWGKSPWPGEIKLGMQEFLSAWKSGSFGPLGNEEGR